MCRDFRVFQDWPTFTFLLARRNNSFQTSKFLEAIDLDVKMDNKPHLMCSSYLTRYVVPTPNGFIINFNKFWSSHLAKYFHAPRTREQDGSLSTLCFSWKPLRRTMTIPTAAWPEREPEWRIVYPHSRHGRNLFLVR